MKVDRRFKLRLTAWPLLAGLLPLVVAAPVEPAGRTPDGAGGPFLPKTIARSAEHLQPKLTLAVHHQSYRMVSAGPILIPEGGLELSLRDLNAEPQIESEARLAVTYSTPTATVRPQTDRHWALAYMPPSVTSEAGLPGAGGAASQRAAELVFERDGSLLSEEASAILEDLADRALKSGTRVQILAYAGEVNDRSSASRRLALRRGLAVRTYLNELGIPKTRMSVHPIGGVGDTGPLDRVDILLPAS